MPTTEDAARSVNVLDKDSPVPLYYQIQQILADRIDDGEWQPGMQVPSERELCEQFRVSRITVRQALSALANQGRLNRQQGVGTFVASPRIKQRLNRLTGFTQEMETRGQNPGAQVLQLEVVPAPPAVARALGMTPGEAAVLLKRLRLADGEPVALEIAHLPAHYCPGLERENLEDDSLYDVLGQRFDIIPARAEQQIEALACPAAEARLLGVRKGAPTLHMYRVTYSSDGELIEHTESFYRGDRYIFHVELAGNGAQGSEVGRKAGPHKEKMR